MSNKFNGFTVDEIHKINSKSEQGNLHILACVVFSFVSLSPSIYSHLFDYAELPCFFLCSLLLLLLLRVNECYLCENEIKVIDDSNSYCSCS